MDKQQTDVWTNNGQKYGQTMDRCIDKQWTDVWKNNGQMYRQTTNSHHVWTE